MEGLGPWDDVDVMTPLYGLLLQIYGIGFEYLVPLGYIYIYMYMYMYIYAQRLGFAQALQRRGFPFTNK